MEEKLIELGMTKLAEEEKDEHAGKKGLAGLLGGGVAIRRASPKITGRSKLYHGTHPDNYKNILKDGIKAKFTGQEGSNTEILKDVNPEAFKKSLGKSFAAKDYSTAKGYSVQSRLGGMKNIEKGNLDNVSLKDLNPFRKDTVKINAPLRKMKTTGNPEIGGLDFKAWKEKLKKTKPGEVRAMGDSQLRSAYKSLKDKTVTFEGDIPTKYIKGSDDYKRVGLGEIKNFAKKNPKKFAGGAALAGLGAAGAGYGAKKLYDKWKSRKEDD